MSEQKAISNVFRNRNFSLVFFGALVSELGAVMYSFAVSFYILEITSNNAFLQGLYLALCGAVLLVFTPIGGVLGDRYNKAKIMFICDYLKGGVILLAVLFMGLFRSNGAHLAILFITGILGNAVSGIFSPAAGSLFPHIVEEDQLQQANAYFSLKNALLTVFGVVLAGVLYAAMPVSILFFMVGICYILSGISEMFIRYVHQKKEGKLTVSLALADMKDGMDYLRSQKAILALMTAILFINFFYSPFTGNFIPYFVKTDIAEAASYLFESFLTPELWSSVFIVMFGISSLAGSLILSQKEQEDKCGRKTAVRLLAIACVMFVVTVCYRVLVDRGVSLNAFLCTFCAVCLLMGFLIAHINIPVNTAVMRIVDRDKLSKVSSYISVVSQGLIPLSSMLAGIILQYAGSAPLLMICSCGFMAAALFLMFNKHVSEI